MLIYTGLFVGYIYREAYQCILSIVIILVTVDITKRSLSN